MSEDYHILPFVTVRDTREQAPYDFRGMRAGSKHGNVPLIVPIEDRVLKTGDYAISGLEDLMAVERKSKSDCFSSLSQGRERLEREFERMKEMEIAHFVVECEWSDVFGNPPPHSKLNPKSIHGTMTSWVTRYPNVHWHMCPGRAFAERTCLRLLQKFWEHRQEKNEGAR